MKKIRLSRTAFFLLACVIVGLFAGTLLGIYLDDRSSNEQIPTNWDGKYIIIDNRTGSPALMFAGSVSPENYVGTINAHGYTKIELPAKH